METQKGGRLRSSHPIMSGTRAGCDKVPPEKGIVESGNGFTELLVIRTIRASEVDAIHAPSCPRATW